MRPTQTTSRTVRPALMRLASPRWSLVRFAAICENAGPGNALAQRCLRRLEARERLCATAEVGAATQWTGDPSAS